MMVSRGSPRGKIFTIDPGAERLPKEARGHMVMVLAWSNRPRWVQIATVSIFASHAQNLIKREQITSSAASTAQYAMYLPIYPAKKNQSTGIQLKLCNTWEEGWTFMEKNSYVKLDVVYEMPVELLRAAEGANGRQLELQSKSWRRVEGFLRMNPSIDEAEAGLTG